MAVNQENCTQHVNYMIYGELDAWTPYGSSWWYTTVITPWYAYVKLRTVNY